MQTKNYKKGEIIFRQGDPADCMYDIYWGTVGIYLNYGTPGETLLRELETDEFFGEMGMIDHLPRSATAVALERSTVLTEITEKDLGELFKTNPAKVLMIMQQLSRQLRRLTKDYINACSTAADVVKLEEQPEAVSEEAAEEIKSKMDYYAHIKLKGFYINL